MPEISLALSIDADGWRSGSGAPAVGTISIQDFSRNKIVFDSGQAFGRDYATIPLTVTTTFPLQAVEVRTVSIEDGGRTSSGWSDLGTTSALGTLTGVITPVKNRAHYRPEVRLKLAPSVTATTTNMFSVGHVLAAWGQSEDAVNWDPARSQTTPVASITIREQVERLKLGSTCGRNSTNPLKVAGVDALPSGASLSGRIITLTGTGSLKDWSFTDYQIQTSGGANWKITQSICHNPATNVIFYQFLAKPGGRLTLDRITFVGSSNEFGVKGVVSEEENGTGYGKITATRMHMTNMTTDSCQLVAGSIRWSYLHWKKNIAVIPTAWSSATTYVGGEYVYVDRGTAGFTVHKAKVIGGNVNQPPPTSSAWNDAFWLGVDPHTDCATITAAFELACVEYNYMDLSELVIANGGNGANNYVRLQNNTGTGTYVGARIRCNVMEREATGLQVSVPIHMVNFPGPVLIEGNWIRPRFSDGEVFYPVGTVNGARVTWAGNTHIQTGAALATPTNCITGTFVQETNDDFVQMAFHDRVTAGAGGVKHKFVSTATPHTAAFIAAANTLMAECPGDHFMVAWQSKSGTGFAELFNDSLGARNWSDDQALHDFVTADGNNVGVAGASWYASPLSYGVNYSQAFFESVVGTKLDGAALPTGPRQLMSGTGNVMPVDHIWRDVYSPLYTKWVLFEPHLFEPDTRQLLDATHLAAGGAASDLVNIQAIRGSNRAMLLNSLATPFLPTPFSQLSYENGYSTGPTTWIDHAHPSPSSRDGQERKATQYMHGFMQAMGLTGYPVPQFDSVYWEPTGAYVEVWWSGGSITTTRQARGLAALPATFPHWTDVFGWQINGATANNVTIVAGKVRIAPNSGSFISSDVISYGEGGATGKKQVPDDYINKTWMNTPLGVVNGIYGLEGIPVQALPPASALTNTIVGEPMFTTVAGQATRFQDPTAWPTAVPGGQKVSFFIDCKPLNLSATRYLMSVDNLPNLRIELLSTGQLRLNMKDSAGVDVFAAVIIGTVSAGVRFTLGFTIDMGTTNECYTTLNGVATQRNFTGRATAFVTGTKKFRFLADTSGALNFIGDVYKLKVWNDYIPGGIVDPTINTNVRTNGEIVGPAATANAHPWKLGGNVT